MIIFAVSMLASVLAICWTSVRLYSMLLSDRRAQYTTLDAIAINDRLSILEKQDTKTIADVENRLFALERRSAMR